MLASSPDMVHLNITVQDPSKVPETAETYEIVGANNPIKSIKRRVSKNVCGSCDGCFSMDWNQITTEPVFKTS